MTCQICDSRAKQYNPDLCGYHAKMYVTIQDLILGDGFHDGENERTVWAVDGIPFSIECCPN